MKFHRTLGIAASLVLSSTAVLAADLVIATVNNGHMIEMQKLTPHFEKAHPDIKLKWVTLDEGTLRSRVTTDIATKGGQFDVMTIGMYETPIWGKKGWLKELKTDAAYDVDDLLPAMRDGLSVDGKLYAAPFYGESSMLMYRKDLADKAGIKFAERPTWDAGARRRRQDARPGQRRLRHLPARQAGLGRQHGLPDDHGQQLRRPVVRHEVEAAARHQALEGRGHAVRRPADQVRPARARRPTASTRSWRCTTKASARMWVDATIAASFVTDPKQSKVADKVAFAQSPSQVTPKGANWLWAWALAIPAGTKNTAAAQKFITWATSKDYVNLVAKEKGWAAVPTGTRKSTYANPEFMKAAVFAEAEKKAIDSANPNDSTLPKSPYVGVQYAAIPEFQAIGLAVGQQMSAALAGQVTVEQALKTAQTAADREMRKGRYY